MAEVARPLSEVEEAAVNSQLNVVSVGKMPDDAELAARMKRAAEGKVKLNGIMRRPDDNYRP